MSPALFAAIVGIIGEIPAGSAALENLIQVIKGEPLTDDQLTDLEAAVSASDAKLQNKLNADLGTNA
jgi:hypothetical protein